MFLRNNCPKAYGQYKIGKQLVYAGWGITAGSAVLGAVGLAVYGTAHKDIMFDFGITFAVVGLCSFAVGSIPLLCVGYVKRNNAYKIYNNTCASSSATPLTFNLTAGQNGLGIAMQF